MRFETFHDLYRTIRFRLGRADDLLCDAVTESAAKTETGGMIEGEDGADYHLMVVKRIYEGKALAHVSIQRHEDGEPTEVVSITCQMAERNVIVSWPSDGEVDAEALIRALTVENENGAETRAFLERMPQTRNPATENAARTENAEKAARVILAGIGQPPELDQWETPYVAQAIVAMIREPAPFGQAARIERARAWARLPSTQPEWAAFVEQSLG